METLIKKYLEDFKVASKASCEYFAESGKISGTLKMAVERLMEEYAEEKVMELLERAKNHKNK